MSTTGTDQSAKRSFVLASGLSSFFAMLLCSGGGVSTALSQDLSTVIAAMSTPLAYMRQCEAQFGGLRPGILEMMREDAVKLGHDPDAPEFKQALAGAIAETEAALSGRNKELSCLLLKDRLDSFPR